VSARRWLCSKQAAQKFCPRTRNLFCGVNSSLKCYVSSNKKVPSFVLIDILIYVFVLTRKSNHINNYDIITSNLMLRIRW
jgi:hypothetical protein